MAEKLNDNSKATQLVTEKAEITLGLFAFLRQEPFLPFYSLPSLKDIVCWDSSGVFLKASSPT